MSTTTVGKLLLNSVLPASHQITGDTPKKKLNTLMVDLANTNPHLYVTTIKKLKDVGDAVTTDAGITVGLDDIEPDYKRRDAILEPALQKIRKTTNTAERLDIIRNLEAKMLEVTKDHPGQMTPMATSGARGKLVQLQKTVSSPVAAVDAHNQTIPWLISKSYAEGLKPADAWAALIESRRNEIETRTSVSAPGEISKLLVNNMGNQLITIPDCGTHNGIAMSVTDPHIHDRYTTDGVLLTSDEVTRLIARGGSVVVRSPMTCEAHDGICQKCQGLDPRGQLHSIGTNVGMRAAHALGEPLTQMTLNAKHAVRTSGGQAAVLEGLTGFKQLMEIPQSFFNKATLATETGHVTGVKKAPQGGHYVTVGETDHYVPPTLPVLVEKGHFVEAGDALSDGIPKPDELLSYKGLGAGRKYLVDRLYDIYARKGIDVDKRHLETLAKVDLNHVRLLDKSQPEFGMLKGDIVNYNAFRAAIAANSKVVPLDEAAGTFLADNTLHYTAGTPLTQDVLRDLRKNNIATVRIAPEIPAHEPVMKPLSRAPLLQPDWLAKMGHRYLRDVIKDGAAFGELSDLHGTHPIPGFAYGQEFGTSRGGKY